MIFKKIFSIFFFFIFFSNLFFAFSGKINVFAEQQQVKALAQVCLLAQKCDQTNECPNIPGNKGHQILLKTDPRFNKPPANTKIYLVEAVSINNQTFYHTGIKTDRFPSGEEEFRAKAPEQNYRFLGFFNLKGENITNQKPNPTITDGLGNISPIIWAEETWQSFTRIFLGFFEMPQQQNNNDTNTQRGQHQDDIPFDWEAAERDCVKIAWDPEGRVFDAQTLEPISGVEVTLLKKTSSGEFVLANESDAVAGQIRNPQPTSDKINYGGFSFIVIDGTYRLTVSGSGLTFPINNLSGIHPNYKKIYSNIYPAETGLDIIQQGKIEHRDIPVKATPPTNKQVILIESFYQRNKISGTVSHPFTKINFYTKVINDDKTTQRYRLIGTETADKDGKFSFDFDQSNFDIEKNEHFGEIELLKQDLTKLAYRKNNLFTKILFIFGEFKKLLDFKNKVNAQGLQSNSINFEPILPYIEGYAYDQNGNIIPNATIMVMLSDSVIYYQTKADKNGYFKISSEFLPKQSYFLKYVDTSNSITKGVKTTVSSFLKQNQQYLAKNKINLNTYKSIKGETITIKPTFNLSQISPSIFENKTKKSNFFNNYRSQNKAIPTLKEEPSFSNNKPNSQFLIIVIILFILILSIGGISIYYFINKKRLEQSFY